MGEMREVLESIQDHTSVEIKERYRNPSIGMGEVLIGHSKSKIWIVNNDFTRSTIIQRDITGGFQGTTNTGVKGEYSESGSVAIPKNREPAITLLQEYEGPFEKVFINGQRKSFIIRNSAHYRNTGSDIRDVVVGVAGQKNWSTFPLLKDALASLDRLESEIVRKREAEEAAKKKADEFRRKQAEETERLAREEAKRLEEEARKAEEEARKLQQEIEAAQNAREAILSEASKAAAFIREQMSLRRNPVLDKSQNRAKFSNMYNGAAEIINGGPGTGKTTTMIQRLKLLIDRGDLENYIANHPECKLTDEQLDYISSTNDNWVYFSPNELLKKYLQDNMNYEGLTQTNSRTAVWSDFLKNAVRDDYHLAGQDSPFDFLTPKKADKIIYTCNHHRIIQNFTAFFLAQIKEKFARVAKIECAKFNWKIQGSIIIKECAKAETISSIPELIKFLIHIAGVDKRNYANGVALPTGSEIAAEYNKKARDISDRYIQLLKRDADTKHAELLEYIKSLAKTSQPENEDNDDTEEVEQESGDLSVQLFNKVNSLIKKLALQMVDSTVKLTSSQKELLEYIKTLVKEEDLKEIADSAYFVKYISPVLRGFNSYVLNPIPQYYKMYRRSMLDSDKSDWNAELLTEMLDTYKNKRLYHQEQSLLVGFINNICLSLYNVDRTRFQETKHQYLDAYKALCRPVIGVDEATDYSIIDFYGIKSFGHYAVRSYTLCGDTMQLMKEDGITDWNVLKHPLLFEQMDVQNLNISYRQSEELLELADKIYQEERGVKSPYECYLKGRKTPKPLWLELDDIEEKADWISHRVLEIVKAYGNKMPTIAVFTVDKRKAEELKDAIEECDVLNPAGIEVKVCSDNNLEGEKTLRIFPIDQVKGMEFEAVFFYDIDDIDSSSLINKYLYVGLSRASMYLAVTSNGRSEKISRMLHKYFTENANWQ